MTTIAAKDGCMAADTQLTGEYRLRAQKIVQLTDGTLVGGAGAWHRCWAGMLWMLGGEQGDPPKLKDACLLIMRPDGSLHLAEEEFPSFPLLDREAAIGSGAAAAVMAMRAGASAGDAVKATCRIDCGTSEPVQMLRLPKPKKSARKR
jgi:hypothetical protein